MKSAIGKKYLLNPFDLTEADSEHHHQVGVIIWCNVASKYGLKLANNPLSYEENDYCENNKLCRYDDNKFRLLNWIYSIPNGDLRTVQARVRLNNEGVKSGVEDLALDVSSHSWHGLRIEMKKFKGVQSAEQKKWQQFHLDQGYYSVVCFSFIEARNELVRYLQ